MIRRDNADPARLTRRMRAKLRGCLLAVGMAVTTWSHAGITPLGLAPGTYDFTMKGCVFFVLNCTGVFRLYAAPADSPSMTPPVIIPGAASVVTVAGWDAIRVEVPATPEVRSDAEPFSQVVRRGTDPVRLESTASTFGGPGMPRQTGKIIGETGPFAGSTSAQSFVRSDSFDELRIGVTNPTLFQGFYGPSLVNMSFKGDPNGVLRWSTMLFNGYEFEVMTGRLFYAISGQTIDPALPDFTDIDRVAAFKADLIDFLGQPEESVGSLVDVSLDPFSLVSRTALRDTLSRIDAGASWNDIKRLPMRGDIETFLPELNVPEPATLGLLLAGLGGLAWSRRRDRKGTASSTPGAA